MKQVLAIARKEINTYFNSPMAYLFLATFLAATLFNFFWLRAFFTRGIADVRPLFEGMPLLLLFLVAALTMRQWSEEQRSGTLEVLLTLPVPTLHLVVGKALAVLTLVAVALGLTLFLPLSVSLIGNLDWGPVVGGYLAALLLAAAYTALGLFVSSRTDNQIVALISTVALGGVLYLLGAPAVTDFFGTRGAELLRALGTGSRFASIERGVIDVRDLLYYLALAGIFLALNVLSLESKRWSKTHHTLPQRRGQALTAGLLLANLVLVNVWVYPLQTLRLDLTAQREYTLSDTTRALLADLDEPLLIRGYFSERTHPKLAPLVPVVRDLLEEYRLAGRGKVTVEIVDPAQNEAAEAEAAQVYGIKPTPFQVTGQYEASIINSYFDIVVRYGDQWVKLNFEDLIEVQYTRDGDVLVHFRNLEYDLTRSIKKVVYGFQSVEAVLSTLENLARLTLYVTPDTLPETMQAFPQTVQSVVDELNARVPGKLEFKTVNPDDPAAGVTREALYQRYGLRPIAASLFSDQTFYLYLVLEVGERGEVIYPRVEMSSADLRSALEGALKRLTPGFLKTVGLWTPDLTTQGMFGMAQPLSSWQQLSSALESSYQVQRVNLSTGEVPAGLDALLLVAPQNLGEKELYAIDQYLMRGGSVIVLLTHYNLGLDSGNNLTLMPIEGRINDLLAHYGVQTDTPVVMDTQNQLFVIPYTRYVQGQLVQDLLVKPYPYLIDIRSNAMAANHLAVAGLPAVSLAWSSPLTVTAEAATSKQVTTLLRSSPRSWLGKGFNITPNYELYPDFGFAIPEATQPFTVAVSLQGSFTSYFADRTAPIGESDPITPTATLAASPETARLVVIGSSEFVSDVVLRFATQLNGDRTYNNLQLVLNTLDWATEDTDLLRIRARGTAVRVLLPLSRTGMRFVTNLNLLLALGSLLAIAAVVQWKRRRMQPLTLDTNLEEA